MDELRTIPRSLPPDAQQPVPSRVDVGEALVKKENAAQFLQ